MPIVLRPVNADVPIKLDKPIILIGRDSGCDVVLQRRRRVSRRHCCVALVDGRVFIRDLGSLNGVWVNGKRIEKEQELHPGDQVLIGDVEYHVEQVERRSSKEQARPIKPVSPREVSPQELSQDFPVPLREPIAEAEGKEDEETPQGSDEQKYFQLDGE